jgi:hypothetical protein
MLTLIEAELKKLKLGYLKLTGRTKDRGALVEEFQNGTVPLFLISLKAGGSGLNLTAADTVIHYVYCLSCDPIVRKADVMMLFQSRMGSSLTVIKM